MDKAPKGVDRGMFVQTINKSAQQQYRRDSRQCQQSTTLAATLLLASIIKRQGAKALKGHLAVRWRLHLSSPTLSSFSPLTPLQTSHAKVDAPLVVMRSTHAIQNVRRRQRLSRWQLNSTTQYIRGTFFARRVFSVYRRNALKWACGAASSCYTSHTWLPFTRQ